MSDPGDFPPYVPVPSSYELPTDFTYPTRKVADGSPALVDDITVFGKDFDYSRPPGGINPSTTTYRGSQLVDRNGAIARKPYSVKEAYGELARKGRGDRMAFLAELYDRGVYNSGSKPSRTGFESEDVNAMENYLMTMNRYGVTADAGLGLFRQEFNTGMGGVGGRGKARRVTSSDDLKAVFNKSAQELLGRELSEQESNSFARMYQGIESAGGRGNEQPPNASVAAEKRIGKKFGAEADAYKFAEFAKTILGGG